LFHSPRWIYDRTELENYVGILLTTENVIDVVINKKDN
jgi:hypothetical protein